MKTRTILLGTTAAAAFFGWRRTYHVNDPLTERVSWGANDPLTYGRAWVLA